MEASAELSWNAIPCPHQNGIIQHYLIVYDYVLPNGTLVEGHSRTLGNILRITLLDLRPNTDYVVRVAGVNHGGVGVYSSPLALITPGGKKKWSCIKHTVIAVCLSLSLSR